MKNPKPCPTCEKPSHEDFAPFCSKRCADIDLHRWFSGAYALPTAEDANIEDLSLAELIPLHPDERP